MKKPVWLLVLMLSGCVNLGEDKNAPAVVYYVLEDAASVDKAAAVDPSTLLLLDTLTTSFYDTTNLAFSRGPGTRGQYQFAQWTERPGKRFGDLLRARLDTWGGFAGVATAGSQVRGDLLLDTQLVEFYHDAATPPGNVRVVLDAELVDLKTRSLVARKRFERRVDVSSYDAQGAATGFNRAISLILDDIEAWLAASRK